MVTTTTVEVDAPVELVFDFITDPRNNPTWQRGVTGAEILGDGQLRSGMRVVERRRVAGREVSIPFTVPRYERPTLRTFEVTSRPVRPRGQMRFRSLGPERTRVEIEVALTGNTFGQWPRGST